MERQRHSITTLFDSLVKYSVEKTISVTREDDGTYVLVFTSPFQDLHVILNILKSTSDVFKSEIKFGISFCIIKVWYNCDIPF